jgi:hypothetical protein
LISVVIRETPERGTLMLKVLSHLVVLATASAFLGGSLVWAQGKGPGQRPPGWEKGEKKGWEGDAPPGLEKKQEGDAKKTKKEKAPKEKAKVAGQEKEKKKVGSEEKEKEKDKDKEDNKEKEKGKAKKKEAKRQAKKE